MEPNCVKINCVKREPSAGLLVVRSTSHDDIQTQ